MSEASVLNVRRDGRVLWLRLNRPDARNALDVPLAAAITCAFGGATGNAEVRAVVLTGNGPSFCAGVDLKALQANPGHCRPDILDAVTEMFDRVRSFPKPVICALNGVTVAGGLELAMCCDVILAAESATIGDGHSNFGVVPGGGAAALLPQRIGLHRAKAMLFTGNILPAKTWAEWGLVHRVVPDDQLDIAADEFAQLLVRKSPMVLRRMKRAVNATMEMSQLLALRNELAELRDHMKSADFREGMAAFTERRTPNFE